MAKKKYSPRLVIDLKKEELAHIKLRALMNDMTIKGWVLKAITEQISKEMGA